MKWNELLSEPGGGGAGASERQTAPGSPQRSGPRRWHCRAHGSQRWLAGWTGPSALLPSRLPPLPDLSLCRPTAGPSAALS